MTNKEKAAREYAETIVDGMGFDPNGTLTGNKQEFTEWIETDYLQGAASRQSEVDELIRQRDESLERERIARKIIDDKRKEIEKLTKK